MRQLDPRAYGRLALVLDAVLGGLDPDHRRRVEAVLGRPGARAVLALRLTDDRAAAIADLSLETDDEPPVAVASIDASLVGYHVVDGEFLYAPDQPEDDPTA